jgi:NitT/TauT family transport system permease protein
MITKIVIPDAAPDIFAGIRIGFAYIVTSVVAVEFLLVTRGLGGRISNAYLRFSTTEMFVSITLVLLLVVFSIALFRNIEGRIRQDAS